MKFCSFCLFHPLPLPHHLHTNDPNQSFHCCFSVIPARTASKVQYCHVSQLLVVVVVVVVRCHLSTQNSPHSCSSFSNQAFILMISMCKFLRASLVVFSLIFIRYSPFVVHIFPCCVVSLHPLRFLRVLVDSPVRLSF